MPTYQTRLPEGFVLKEPNMPIGGLQNIPLDPNKLLKVLPETEGPLLKRPVGAPSKPLFPSREPVPSIAGFVSEETLGGRMLRKAPQIAGGTLGGIIGAAIPTIGEEPATIAGGSALAQYVSAPLFAAAGGAVGRAYTLNPNDPNYGRKLAFAAIEEAGGEIGGRIIAGAGGRIFLRPFRSTVVPGAETADQMLRSAGKATAKTPKTWVGKTKQAAARKTYRAYQAVAGEPGVAARMGEKYGAHLLPGQTTEGIMDSLQAIGEASLGTGPTLHRLQTQTQVSALKSAQGKLVNKIRNNLVKKVGAKKAAAIIGDLSNVDNQAVKIIGDSLYSTVDDAADIAIDFSPVREFAQGEVERWTKAGGFRGKLRVMLNSANKYDDASFLVGKDRRSLLLNYGRQFEKSGDTIAARVAKTLASKVDEAMELSAKAASPETYTTWRLANDFYRGELRLKWLSNTLTKYGKGERVATGKAFVSYIRKMDETGQLVKMGFSSDETKNLLDVATTTAFVGTKATSGGMTMLVRLTQAGAIVGIPIGMATDQPVITGAGAFFLIGPELLARTMLSRTGSQLLSTGLRAPAGSRSLATTGVRLLREVGYHEIERRRKGKVPQLSLQLPIGPPIEPSVFPESRPEQWGSL